jgi:hypothetical protein
VTTMDIGYVTDDPAPAYAKAVKRLSGRNALIEAIYPFRRVAADALECATSMTDDEFRNEFKPGLLKERRGEFAGEEWAKKYACILMPEVMFQVSLVSMFHHAPWGLAFIRMREHGRIEESPDDGGNPIARMVAFVR